MLRGAFFDLDNTLIATRAAETGALEAGWLKTFGNRYSIDVEKAHRALRVAYETQFAYGTPGSGYAELCHLSGEEITTRLFAEVLPHLGVTEPDGALLLARACAEVERKAFCLIPDALETLQTLRSAGLKLGLITNGPGLVQRDKLAYFALEAHLDAIVIDSEFGHPKPDQRIFAHAASLIGLAPEELLFVGDNAAADIGGARQAGWLAVWFNPDGLPYPSELPAPHYTLSALTQLLTLPEIAGTGLIPRD